MGEFCKEYLVDGEVAQIICGYCRQKRHRENRKEERVLQGSHARTYKAYNWRELYLNKQHKLSALLVYELITFPILEWFLIDVRY